MDQLLNSIPQKVFYQCQTPLNATNISIIMKTLKVKFLYLSLLLVVMMDFTSTECNAQAFNKQEFNDSIKKLPYFTLHKDIYFITGVPTNKEINSSTSNAKYQISFKKLLTKDLMPWDSYLFITYSQKAFWDIYKDSYPFEEINFNPTIGLGKAIFGKDDRLKGIATLAFEHESNGRDSIFSRSWNRISLYYSTKLAKNTDASLKVWIPFGYRTHHTKSGYPTGNPELLEYVGLGEFNLSREFIRDKLSLRLTLRKGLNLDAKGMIRSRIYYNPFKKNKSSQYIMLEWYLGQAESMIDYEASRSMVRIGYVIKSDEFNWFRGKR